jgi:membrane protease subunit (stomatin/prohibitin family)
MIRTIALVVFGLTLASAAQAMPLAPMHRTDSIVTQTRMGCGMGRVMVNGVCQSRAGMRQERRAMRRCARYHGGVCVQ